MAATTLPTLKRAPQSDRPAAPILLYACLTFIALVSSIYQTRVSQSVVHALRDKSVSVRTPFALMPNRFEVHALMPEATAAGMREGDRVMVVGERPLYGLNDILRELDAMRPGQMLRVQAMRGGSLRTFNLKLSPQPSNGHDSGDLAIAVILVMLMPWFCIALGVYIAAARIRDPLAWIVLGLMLSFTGVVGTAIYMWGDWIRVLGELFHTLMLMLYPTFMFLFGYYFPERPLIDRRVPWLKWVVVAPFVLFALTGTPLIVGTEENLRAVQPWIDRLYLSKSINIWLSITPIVLGLMLLGIKAFRTSNKDARRRMRLLVSGIVVSLAPIITIIAVTATSNKNIDAVPAFVLIPSILVIALFPATLAYVILVNRAMDVRVVLRQSLQYAFARSGVMVLRVLTLAIFAIAGYWVANSYAKGAAAQVLLAITLLGAVLAVNVTMKRLGLWVDRRFFRDQYNAERVLADLSDQVSRMREPNALAATVSDRIGSALHVTRIAILLEKDGCFETCHTLGFDTPPQIRLARDSGIITHLHASSDPQRVYFDDESSWLYRAPGIDDEQRSCLAYLGSELLLPLPARDQLLGFISAGQKRSEEPYSKSDVRMLSSVANQAGLALENAKLTTAIASEMALRERLAREVEIAREVQERLFPQTMPPIDGLDYAGLCRTALGVGGDYYDFLALPGHRLGFAVGDVAGKGISAALLMASLQASLRGETSHGTDNLAGLIGNLNRRVFEASANNRYATFFYGQYTPEARRVDYVNAGHNPPILMRRNGAEWETTLLDATGTVVGLIATSEYSQASVDLHPGDYLVAFTDGISEAMNSDDEEWGEERLTETIRACAEASLTASETVIRILSAADTFVAGAKQHDDMTVTVFRVEA